MTEHTEGFALITGASSGIGAIYADRLARRRYDLILVARRADRLQAIAERITAEMGRKVEIVVADLSDCAATRDCFPAPTPTRCSPRNQNIENNPMQSDKGAPVWMIPKNILTRRANHRHYSIVTQFVKRAWPCPATGRSVRLQAKKSF
jgi:hypothetical protein